MKNGKVSNAVIRRLPRYYGQLNSLYQVGVVRISSSALAKSMNLTASQIRQDLSYFGEFGQQGYGYHVETLYREIGHILGLDKTHNMIGIGAGNLGQALANYANFEKRGFRICALFDKNPALVGTKTVRGIEIFSIDDLEEYMKDHEIEIAVMTIPKTSSEGVSARLCACGIKAIWNFSHTDLDVPEGIVVENVHLSESLMKLSYAMEGKK